MQAVKFCRNFTNSAIQQGIQHEKIIFYSLLCTFSVSSFALTPRIETASNSDSFISFRTANDAIYCSGDLPGLNPRVECVTNIKGKPILPRPKDCEFEWGRAIFLLARQERLHLFVQVIPPLYQTHQS